MATPEDILMGEPKGAGGQDPGPSPSPLYLSLIHGCSSGPGRGPLLEAENVFSPQGLNFEINIDLPCTR